MAVFETHMKNYSIEWQGNISIVRFASEFSVSDVREAVNELAIKNPGLRLWDLSNGINLSRGELQDIAEYGKSRLTPAAKLAIVAPSDVAFGLSRGHQVYREQAILLHRVFRTEREAIDWLEQ